jgi:hypothetical protein
MPGFAQGERPCWWFRRSLREGKGNVLLNPQQADFKKIFAGVPEPVIWNARLFGGH